MGDITPDHVSHLPERMAIRKDLMAVLRRKCGDCSCIFNFLYFNGRRFSKRDTGQIEDSKTRNCEERLLLITCC